MKMTIVETEISDDWLVGDYLFMDYSRYWHRSPISLKEGDIVHHGAGQQGNGTIYKIIRDGQQIHADEQEIMFDKDMNVITRPIGNTAV